MAGAEGIEAVAATLPEVDTLAPKRLRTGEHRYRSVRFFRTDESPPWQWVGPWVTTIVDLDTKRGIVDGRTGVGAQPLPWRLGVATAATYPSAAFRKAPRMWLPRTAASVDAFNPSTSPTRP